MSLPNSPRGSHFHGGWLIGGVNSDIAGKHTQYPDNLTNNNNGEIESPKVSFITKDTTLEQSQIVNKSPIDDKHSQVKSPCTGDEENTQHVSTFPASSPVTFPISKSQQVDEHSNNIDDVKSIDN